MANIKVEVVEREMIRPSLPTQPHLKSYRLSRFDHGNPLCYTSVVLFYACNDEKNQIGSSKHLKESLSNALPNFYPFAGRLKDNLSIDCNDDGVAFSEAQVSCSLSSLFEQPNLETITHLVPMESTEMTTDPQLLIQVNSFIGGGMALGVNISHKIADAATLSKIIKFWADSAIGKPDAIVPDLKVADLYPSVDSTPGVLTSLPPPLVYNDREILRIVFEAGRINSLKGMVKGIENPTRVEVVTALLWKCAIKASMSTGSVMPHVMISPINMRPYLIPPVPKNACGNVLEAIVVVVSEEKEIDLSYIVSSFRKAKAGRTNLSPHPVYGFSLLDLKSNMLTCSSWTRMSFYEADFGWGNPMWACFGVLRGNGFSLMDSQEGDGIEAWIKLNEKDMALFEKDEELIAFGSINPSVNLH